MLSSFRACIVFCYTCCQKLFSIWKRGWEVEMLRSWSLRVLSFGDECSQMILSGVEMFIITWHVVRVLGFMRWRWILCFTQWFGLWKSGRLLWTLSIFDCKVYFLCMHWLGVSWSAFLQNLNFVIVCDWKDVRAQAFSLCEPFGNGPVVLVLQGQPW